MVYDVRDREKYEEFMGPIRKSSKERFDEVADPNGVEAHGLPKGGVIYCKVYDSESNFNAYVHLIGFGGNEEGRKKLEGKLEKISTNS
tara:strand:- start:54 stop:317 length:264 start_codon:yes stop_codon:yes gene_type:complete